MSKPRWQNGRLDLGRLGGLFVHKDPDGMHTWGLDCEGPLFICGDTRYAKEAAAQRAAERWLRAALKQAAKRMED